MRIRVLIMEDNAGLAGHMAGFLKDAGYDCRVVDGVARALREARSFGPHLVLSDFHVIDGTAADLLAGLKAQGSGGLPVVLATAAGPLARNVADEYKQVCGILEKPVALELLPPLIERFADRSVRPLGWSPLIGPDERHRLLHASCGDEVSDGTLSTARSLV
jgi:DNA-binding NtrC family response regulator